MIFCRRANLRSISLQEWNMFYNDIYSSFKGISVFIQLHTIKKILSICLFHATKKSAILNDTTTAIGKNRYKL